MRRLAWLLGLPLGLAAVAVGSLWVWSGADGSLATALRQAPRFLPPSVTVSAQDVTGSLRHGGSLASLTVTAEGQTVVASTVTFQWHPLALWDRHLQLDSLQIADLNIQTVAQDGPKSPPPTDLSLPLRISAHLKVDKLEVGGAAAFAASQLDLRYDHNDATHTLLLDSLQVAAGRYQGKVTLGANDPLALNAHVQAVVTTPVPGSTRSLTLQGQVDASGTLAGANPLLDLRATLQPAEGSSAAQAARVSATAQISPWADQPVVQADARLARLDLSALWPSAPQTLLDGSVEVRPVTGAPEEGQQWRTSIALRNQGAGPWDQKKLPLTALDTKARILQRPATSLAVYIDALQMQVAGGNLQGQGQWQAGGTTPWQGSVTVSQINPAMAYSALDPAALDGRLQARAQGQGIAFDLALRPSARQPVATALARLPGVTLRSASAQGSWANGTLTLSTLRVQTTDALLQGQLTLQPAEQAAQADLRLTSPGAEARLRGALAPLHGTGDITLNVNDAARVMRWARPLLNAVSAVGGSATLATLPSIQGQAALTASWQGGWQKADALTVRARLDVPQLDVRPAGATATHTIKLRGAEVQANGQLSAMALTARGQVDTQGHRLAVQAQASGGRSATDTWSAQLGQLQAQASLAGRTGTWTVALHKPVALRWQRTPDATNLSTGSGELRLTSPLPGEVAVAWSPVQWRAGSGGISTLQSSGKLTGLPLGWLDLVGQNGGLLSDTGLKGNLIFDGSWDAQLGDALQLQATLSRRSGDISLRLDEELTGQAALTQQAGVREASLKIESNGRAVSATVQWDSANAGQIQATVGTELARQGDAWAWPSTAPVSGKLRAQLPRVGAWTALAPPGWRVQGTLDANATIAGTRADPQWRGTLLANEMSMRSVVEGIDLTGGKLRASIAGQRLEIEEFSFKGAGTDGGQLVAKGFAQWLPAPSAGSTTATTATPAVKRVQIELTAKATGLRLAARADRRLALSGQVQARLDDARLIVRGGLKVDSALFILPDQSTPSLGEDVFVRGRTAAAPAANGNAVRVMPDVSLTLALGPDFRIQGRGLATRLEGELTLRNTVVEGQFAPRLTGEVRTVKGSYKAYGQQLEIEQGVLRFAGPYDNPSLDVRAIRPNITQRVGVEITGTVLTPRVRLFSDPSLPDAEALAWLVLGRSASGGGAEAAVLQQAALALLGGSGKGMSATLMDALGLDELSFRGASTLANGTASGATVTLGKRLSSDFYVAYERGLASTLGTFFIFYDLSRYFTLRGQTGETSAVDLIFTAPYD